MNFNHQNRTPLHVHKTMSEALQLYLGKTLTVDELLTIITEPFAQTELLDLMSEAIYIRLEGVMLVYAEDDLWHVRGLIEPAEIFFNATIRELGLEDGAMVNPSSKEFVQNLLLSQFTLRELFISLLGIERDLKIESIRDLPEQCLVDVANDLEAQYGSDPIPFSIRVVMAGIGALYEMLTEFYRQEGMANDHCEDY